MPEGARWFIRPAEGFRAREAASFFSQMEDQSRRLFESLRGITPDELEWQPAPGMNTIGMLLAHFAVAETLWAQVAFLGMTEPDTKPAIGLDRKDDGMPLGPGGEPPAILRGKTLADYEALLARARAYYREAAAKLSEDDMDRAIRADRPDGTKRSINIRWAMYHVLEHFAAHFGQLLLIRHLYRARVPPGGR